jgi:hypothetical protein
LAVFFAAVSRQVVSSSHFSSLYFGFAAGFFATVSRRGLLATGFFTVVVFS